MTSFLDRAFASYQLVRRLGGGGMGEVYLARTKDGREVALKLIEMHDEDDSRDIVAAERVGAQLQQQFGEVDAHVPAVYGVGEAHGCFYIEMEYVDGHDLAELIPDGIAPEGAAAIGADVAAFLEKAHAFSAQVDGREFRALVHADLKPKNIRINSRHEVKVLDFGISKGLSLTGRLTTAAFGSRSYMSPEWLDTGRLDRHVDLWALGVVLYEMIAAGPPFKAENARQLELMLRARARPLPLPDACPASLGRIVFKALAPALEARYTTAAAFKVDLHAWLAGRSTVADEEWASALNDEVTRRTQRPPEGTPESEATRRTTAAEPAASEATVRTVPPPVPQPAVDAPSSPTAPAPVPVPRRGGLRRWTSRAALGLMLLAVANEYAACRVASALRADLPTREDADLDAAWERYRTVGSRSLLGIARRQVDEAMEQALVTHADRVIADFRQERPTVRERQWDQARMWLANALRVDPGNASLLARLRYCEGHLSRIDGEARLKDGQRPDADRLLHAAVARFDEAAKLDRAWADPWLGLMRTYIYGLEDLKKAVEALNEAERRSYRAGRREFAQLGEAYLAQAERSRRDCDKLPAERICACLQRAGEDYRQSASWLDRAPGYGDTARGLVRAHAGLRAVTDRASGLICWADPASGQER
jgi:serine/threonine-protein kinase